MAELLVSVGVLVLLVFLFTQLINSAATVTTLGQKQMDADSQARQVLNRMAIDFAQMVKRSDVDYYLKSSAAAPLRSRLQPGNDQIAFYSTLPGYYPTNAYLFQSPMSVVAYRIYNPSPTPSPCPNCNKLERMSAGLLWNGYPGPLPTPTPTLTPPPVLFMPVPLAAPLSQGDLPTPTPTPSQTPAWPQAGNMDGDSDYDVDVAGAQVFRFEYYYLLTNGALSDIPWDSNATHNAVNGMRDVAAIIVDIAVIDPKSRVLVTDAQLARLNGADGQPPVLVDYDPLSMTAPGQLRTQWRAALDANTIGLPRPAIAGIRLYERYFYLSTPTLGTP